MFKHRLISFTALLGLMAVIFFAGPFGMHVFRVTAAVVAALLVNELGAMLEKIDLYSWRKVAAAVAGLFTLGAVYNFFGQPAIAVALFSAVSIFGFFMLLNTEEFALGVKKLAVSSGILLLSLPLVLGLAYIGEKSLMLFAFFALVTKSGDTGAYCIGMLSNIITRGGNHQVAPRISPKKSIEGTVGGLIVAIGVSFGLGWGCGMADYSWAVMIMLGIALFWGGFFGDLTESVMKRGCGVKDSGTLLPGMGGVWDVMDSFIYNAPVLGLIFYVFPLN